MKERKKEEEKKHFFSGCFYALKILRKYAPDMFAAELIRMFTFWFFTGFIQDILFLKFVLRVIENGEGFKKLTVTVLSFAVSGLLSYAIIGITEALGQKAYQKASKKLSLIIFNKARSVDVSSFDDPVFYDKFKRATEVVTDDTFADCTYFLATLVSGTVTGIFIVYYVISVDPKMLLLTLTVFLIIALQGIESKMHVKRDNEMTRYRREKDYIRRTLHRREYAKDIRTSAVFGVMMSKFEYAIGKNREIFRKYGFKTAVLECASEFFGEVLPLLASYSYATYRFALKKNMKFSDFSVIMTAMSNLADVINDLSYAVSYLREKSLYFCNLRDFLKYENKVTGGSEIPGELEKIEFKNVSFTYPDSDKPAVRELDLIFTKNETTAIVGHNGAGKTTFFKLLLRFYDPDCGEILYNGVNIKEYDLEKYRSKIAAVFQDYSVFALTVEENVLCREIKTEDDRSAVLAALKNSGAEEFVQKLPKKEKTVLTREFDKDGTGLSGGEQQKLAAARMFAKNFEAAVLDEPSSALDPIAEYKMYENLIKGTAGKAVIYISHRLSSATLSDKIYLFENGTVSEKGTHGELMNLNGEYARMFALQASGYSDETEVYAE